MRTLRRKKKPMKKEEKRKIVDKWIRAIYCKHA
jgi:hypothetical protein